MAWQAVANPRKEVTLLAVDLDMQRGLTEPVSPVQSSPVQSSPVQSSSGRALRCAALHSTRGYAVTVRPVRRSLTSHGLY